MRRTIAVCVAAAVAGCLLGCEPDQEKPAEEPRVTGAWSVKSGDYRRVMELTQTGQALSGKVAHEDGKMETVTGAVSGNSVTLNSGDVSGTGTWDGDTMRGEYRRDNGAKGRWTAARQPAG
jgi:uncharacterized protein (DUF2147 family)